MDAAIKKGNVIDTTLKVFHIKRLRPIESISWGISPTKRPSPELPPFLHLRRVFFGLPSREDFWLFSASDKGDKQLWFSGSKNELKAIPPINSSAYHWRILIPVPYL